MTLKQLDYKELMELARPSNRKTRNIVFVQFRNAPNSVTMSDYYRVASSFIDDNSFDNCLEPIHFERIGRGKCFSVTDGFKRNTYMREWCAFLVRAEPIKVAHIAWEVENGT